jgi:isopentenyl-diphosphate delta-isomerase
MSDIVTRKDQHLDVILSGRARHGRDSGLDAVRFVHEALPDLDYGKIDLGVDFLGRRLKAPLLISAMTGGPARAEAINARLAEAAQHLGIALAVGSQRAALEAEGGTPGLDMALRLKAPDTPILANIGAAQLTRGVGADEARRIVDMIAADALIVHLNPLQEACQPEGDRDWWGVGGQGDRGRDLGGDGQAAGRHGGGGAGRGRSGRLQLGPGRGRAGGA